MGSQHTVLIVDDSPEDRELYRRYLLRGQNSHYRLLEATLGHEGLNQWQHHRPDVVLLDFRLPDLDGLEFLARLHQQVQQPYLPVIIVTGQGNEAIAVQAMKAGAQDYLVKEQMTPEGLRFSIHEVIDKVRLRTELHQRIERERLMTQITQQIHRSLDLQDILQTTVDQVRRFLQSDRAFIYRFQADITQMIAVESVGAEWPSMLQEPLAPDGLGYLEEEGPQGQVQAIADVDQADLPPGQIIRFMKFQVRASLAVPILQDAKLWGLLVTHQCTGPRSWLASEIDLLQQLATQVGIALQQAELYQQAQQKLAERKQAEAALKDSETRFRQLAENIDAVFWITDYPSRQVRYVSPAYQRLWKFDPQELYDNYQNWAKRIHPDDRAQTEGAFASTAATGGFDQEYRIVLRDGQIRWVHDRCFPLRDDGGNIYRFTGIAEDITDRKRAEQAAQEGKQTLEALMDYIPHGITIADAPDVTIRRVSRHGEQLAGRSRDILENIPAEAHPRIWQILHSGSLQPATSQELPLTRAVQQGEVIQNEEWVLQQPDGTIIYTLCNAGPIRDADGHITGGIIAWSDISDRKQAEWEREHLLRQEQQARAEAERANRIKDEFLAVLSHELRSPLNPILGWANLLQHHTFSPERTAQALATIARNARLQAQLIDDLLDVSRILRGKLSMTPTEVNLATTIEAAMDTVRTASIAKSIHLHPVFSPVSAVLGDPTRLQQIIWNLLSNAIKFTPEGGRVEIYLSEMDKYPSSDPESALPGPAPLTPYAQIQVIDTGKGINPAFLPHIFEYFRQEDALTTRKYGGLGLGLAIVRHLVEAHGGTITADSSGEGKGATFTVRLPLLREEVIPQISAPAPESKINLAGIRVLAVDDDLDTCELCTVLFTQYGAEVKTARTAHEALAVLERFQPHLLISDIGMPDTDGFTLLNWIRALPPDQGGQVPAIALTAYAREEDHRRALAHGFQSHIAKPFDPNQIIQTAVSLLRETK